MNYWGKGRFVLNNALPSPGSFHGLYNEGATCYLNSVLQVLFMTKDFREAVARPRGGNTDPDCIDHHLTRLFDDLKQQTAGTHEISSKLGINKVNEQRDAAEYFQKILSLTSPEASKIFHGELTHRTICSTCHALEAADGLFWLLPLTLVDSTNHGHYKVVDGIEEFFRSSSFSGENQMYCVECDDKSDATVECVMKHHPEVLVLLIKRFEFSYHYMEYVKVSCSVDVPSTLQIPQNQTYELYAVVDHFGDLRSGHYDAKIKSEDDQKWYCFNDSSVSELGYQNEFKRSCNAYLLFYRKNNGHAADTCTQHIIREESAPEDAQHAVRDQCQDVQEEEKEAKEAADMGDDTAAAGSSDRKQDTGVTDIVGVEFRGAGLAPDPGFNAKDQVKGVSARHRINYDNQESNEDGSPLPPQDDHGENEEEDMRGNEDAKKRETVIKESQRKERVKEGNDGAGSGDISQRRPEEGDTHNTSFNDQKVHMHVRHVHLQQVNMLRDEETDSVMGVNEDVGDTQAAGRDYSPERISVDEQKGEDRMETRHEAEKKEGDISRYKRHEQQREEVYRVQEPKRGDDTSEKLRETKPSVTEYVKDQDERRHVAGVTYTRHTDANVKGQTEQENKSSVDSGLRRAASAGGEEGDCQPKFNEKPAEGRRGSNKSRTCRVKIIEEEMRNTRSGTPMRTETREIIIEIPQGSSQDGTEKKSGEKTNLKVSLSQRFHKLKLGGKKEPKKTTKRVREISPEETLEETNSRKKGRGSFQEKKTAKHEKSTGCFPFTLKKLKNKQKSE